MLARLPLLVLALLALLLDGSHAQQDTESAVRTRTPRGTVTLDFGLLLRNLLLKSAQLSSAKANLARTTRRPPPAMTTTTAAPPPPPPNPRRRRPIWHPYFASGYLPFDYDADYADPAVPPPPAPPPPAPQPPRRVRPQPRPVGLYNAQRQAARPPPPPPAPPAPPGPPSYDYDYDYDAPAAPAPAPPPPPPPPPPPAAAPRPRQRQRPQQPQQQPQQPDPRQRRPAQLGDRLVYQYAQPTDTFSRPLALGGGVAALAGLAGLPEDEQQQQQQQEVDLAAAQVAGVTSSDDPADGVDTDTDLGAVAGATAVDNADAQPERSPPRFLVNYESDDDFFAGGTGPGPTGRDGSSPPSQKASSIPGPASDYGFPTTLDFGGLNRFSTPSHQQQQQQYFFK